MHRYIFLFNSFLFLLVLTCFIINLQISSISSVNCLISCKIVLFTFIFILCRFGDSNWRWMKNVLCFPPCFHSVGTKLKFPKHAPVVLYERCRGPSWSLLIKSIKRLKAVRSFKSQMRERKVSKTMFKGSVFFSTFSYSCTEHTVSTHVWKPCFPPAQFSESWCLYLLFLVTLTAARHLVWSVWPTRLFAAADQSVGRGRDGQADGNWWDTSWPFTFPAGGENIVTQGGRGEALSLVEQLFLWNH